MNSPTEISDLEDYITHIDKITPVGKSFLYRGQEDKDWGVTSSAVRRLEIGSTESLRHLYRPYIFQIVDEVQLRYPSIYRDLSPLECLAHLQHNGVATGLIDFTFNPLVALWFACANQEPDTAGKVVVLENDPEQINEIQTTQDLGGELRNFFRADEEKWHLWVPTLDSQVVDIQRMIMQQSVFLFGAPEVRSQMFSNEIVIPNAHKKSIREKLEKVGISEKTLFADHLGFLQRSTTQQPYDITQLITYDGESLP